MSFPQSTFSCTADEFDAAGRRIRQAGSQTESSLRGVRGRFDRLKAAALAMSTALAAGLGGLAGGIMSQRRARRARGDERRGRTGDGVTRLASGHHLEPGA